MVKVSASADGGAAALTAPGLTATGQAALRTAAPRTAAPRTAAPRTAAPRTAAPRTAAPRTAAPRTAAPRTAVLRSAAPRVTRPQVIAPRQTRWGEVGDPLGEEALAAAMSGAGSTVSLAELAGYAILEPGPGLAGWLSSGAAASMDDAALVNSIVSWRKLTSWAQARELQAVAELATRRGAAGKEAPEDPVKKLEASFISSEVALALTLTPTGAEFWMDLAISLTGRLPDTLRALGAGRIDLAKARLIYIFTSDLDEELARAVERSVLDKAEEQTTGQLRAALQDAVISVDPAAAERRCKAAEKNARVELFGDQDGTASLAGRNLPAAHAAAAWALIGVSWPGRCKVPARAAAWTCCGPRSSSACCSAPCRLSRRRLAGPQMLSLRIPTAARGALTALGRRALTALAREALAALGPEGPTALAREALAALARRALAARGREIPAIGGRPGGPASADPHDPDYADPEEAGCADPDRLRQPDPEDPEEAGCADPYRRGSADPGAPDGLARPAPARSVTVGVLGPLSPSKRTFRPAAMTGRARQHHPGQVSRRPALLHHSAASCFSGLLESRPPAPPAAQQPARHR